MSEQAVDGIDEVAGLLDAEVEEGVDRALGAVVIIDKIIAYRGHKLIAGNDSDELRIISRLVDQTVRFGFHGHHRKG